MDEQYHYKREPGNKIKFFLGGIPAYLGLCLCSSLGMGYDNPALFTYGMHIQNAGLAFLLGDQFGRTGFRFESYDTCSLVKRGVHFWGSLVVDLSIYTASLALALGIYNNYPGVASASQMALIPLLSFRAGDISRLLQYHNESETLLPQGFFMDTKFKRGVFSGPKKADEDISFLKE